MGFKNELSRVVTEKKQRADVERTEKIYERKKVNERNGGVEE